MRHGSISFYISLVHVVETHIASGQESYKKSAVDDIEQTSDFI